MPSPDAPSPQPTRIAVAVVQHAGNVLIGRRPEGVALAGLWEFPGGKIESDETAEAAAARECLEETGLAVEVVGAFPQRRHDYAHGGVHLFFFACRPQDPAQQPLAPFTWVAVDRLHQFEFPAANRELLALLAGEQVAAVRSIESPNRSR